MEINQEKPSQLLSKVVITLTDADYMPSVDKALKELRQNIVVPGFRKGMVPVGMVKKMHGVSVLSDEIFKKASQELDTFIRDNKIDYVGRPFLNEKFFESKMEFGQTFTFEFELGHHTLGQIEAPKGTFTVYKPEPSEDVVTKEVEGLRRRFGKSEMLDVVPSEGESMISAELTALNEDKTPVEGKEPFNSFLFLRDELDASTRALFVGKKKEESFDVALGDLKMDEEGLATFLKIPVSSLDTASPYYRIKLTTVSTFAMADMDAEFFDKLGEETIQSEEELRNRIRENIKIRMSQDAEILALEEIKKALEEQLVFDMPVDFLKRWILSDNDAFAEIGPERVDEFFNNIEKEFRWDVIRNAIAKQYEITVSSEDVLTSAKLDTQERLMQMGYQLPEDQIMNIVRDRLKKSDEYNRLYMSILDFRILKKMLELASVAEQTVSAEEFNAILANKKEPQAI